MFLKYKYYLDNGVYFKTEWEQSFYYFTFQEQLMQFQGRKYKFGVIYIQFA